jgi:hypothetical protein
MGIISPTGLFVLGNAILDLVLFIKDILHEGAMFAVASR